MSKNTQTLALIQQEKAIYNDIVLKVLSIGNGYKDASLDVF